MEKREKMIKALKERKGFQKGSLSFSCPKVEFSLKVGETKQGSFTVKGKEGMPLSGWAVTGDIHMRCLTEAFDQEHPEIVYSFDSTGLDEGECIRGEFKLLSNQGEYLLPFMVTIMPRVLETSLGQMKNLFHFANLAKTNWQEAVKVFYMPEFSRLLSGNDRQYLNGYRALKEGKPSQQRVEEFLVWIRKKQRVEYLADRESISVMPSEDITRETITLTRNGWGYTRLNVETDGAFLEAEKAVLTEDDFLGNRCTCGVLIHHDALHAGYNYGKIRFYNEYISFEIPVCAGHPDALIGRQKRNRKQRMAAFYQYYLEYGLGHISKQEWMAQAECVLEGPAFKGRREPLQELFAAHILLTGERYNEARWKLEQAEKMILHDTPPVVRCYYLYLTTLFHTDPVYINSATDEIRREYRADQANWQIAWLLMYLDEECGRSLSRKWLFLEQQFERGCHSPVWYLEAALLVRKNPAFLMKLTPFVQQVLNFMAKHDFLTAECIGQIHYLAGRLKKYDGRMYDILKVCYEKGKDDASLQAICSLLIKSGKTGDEYVGWYREGVHRGIWLTRLYEYYVLSLDLSKEEEEIPAAALRYFSYKSELPYERMAYLYAYLVRHKESYGELYAACLPAIEGFLAKQLEKGRMNRSIACLLRELQQTGLLSESMLLGYADRFFIQEVRIFTPEITRVIAVHGKLCTEASYTVNNGAVYLPVYDEDFALVFEDNAGNRYVYDISYERRELFYAEELLAEMLPIQSGAPSDNAGMLLYQCMHGRPYIVLGKNNIRYAIRLWENKDVRNDYREELGAKLLRYYQEQDMAEEMDELLVQLRPDYMNGREREEALTCLILRGMYETAFSWLDRYGAERVPPKLLIRLCSRLLQSDIPPSQSMTTLMYLAFRKGKYEEGILCYLGTYFIGTVKEMLGIWHACRRFDAESAGLTERILLQMLFTREFSGEEITLLQTYLEEGADEALLCPYLAHLSYEYFVRNVEQPPFVWKELFRIAANGEELDEICKLALLSHFVQKGRMQEEERKLARRFLEELVLRRGIVFSFFRNFAQFMPVLDCYQDETFLEYRTSSGNPLTLHFMRKTEEGGEYRTELLKSCYAGIYVRRFLLFFGETLQYYITEKKGQKEILVQSGTLQGAAQENESCKGRLPMLDELMKAVSGQEQELAERILEKYCRTEFMAEGLFSLQ